MSAVDTKNLALLAVDRQLRMQYDAAWHAYAYAARRRKPEDEPAIREKYEEASRLERELADATREAQMKLDGESARRRGRTLKAAA